MPCGMFSRAQVLLSLVSKILGKHCLPLSAFTLYNSPLYFSPYYAPTPLSTLVEHQQVTQLLTHYVSTPPTHTIPHNGLGSSNSLPFSQPLPIHPLTLLSTPTYACLTLCPPMSIAAFPNPSFDGASVVTLHVLKP